MKKEDVKIGMRVVPHDKTPEGYCGNATQGNDWKGFCNSNNNHKEHFKFFKENGYLYVSKIYDSGDIVCLSYDGKAAGSTFRTSDFEPYIEQPSLTAEQKKLINKMIDEVVNKLRKDIPAEIIKIIAVAPKEDKPTFEVGEWVTTPCSDKCLYNQSATIIGIHTGYADLNCKCSKCVCGGMGSTNWKFEWLTKIPQPPKEKIIDGFKYVRSDK